MLGFTNSMSPYNFDLNCTEEIVVYGCYVLFVECWNHFVSKLILEAILTSCDKFHA